jgi:hypothetical protein
MRWFGGGTPDSDTHRQACVVLFRYLPRLAGQAMHHYRLQATSI